MQTIKVMLEYVACYSSAFLIGTVVGGVIGFYVRRQWDEQYGED